MRLRRLLLAVMLLGAAAMARAEGAVWIAVSEGSQDYLDAAEALRSQLIRGDATLEVVVRSWSEASKGILPQVKALVCLGTQACAGVTDASASGRLARVPVVAAMLPRSAYEALRRRMLSPMTAVVLDQPLARQMALLRYAFPHLRRVGVMLGPDAVQLQSGLEKAAMELSLQPNIYKVEGEANLYPVLQRVLEENDVLLAIPDPVVYNGGSIQNVLLASYRQKVPMIGFSPAYVRAGAILALYSTPNQIGNQGARVVRGVLAGAVLPPPQSPSEFVVGVNASVARSLGFRLSEDALRIQLQNREGM